MALRWYTLAPDMVIYFIAIVMMTKVLENVLMRYCAVYRDHLNWHQRRKLITHGWLALTAVMGFIIQCIAYMPALFTGTAIPLPQVRMLLALSTVVITVYMHDLAYTRANLALMLHHLATALALVLVAFTINDTNQIQTLLMFSTIFVLFETLSGTTYVAMILHRLWGSPVPHPTRYAWAGQFMAAAAWWFVHTRVFVYAFGLTRYVQVAKLGQCQSKFAPPGTPPLSKVCGGWYWTWLFFMPILLLALLYAHYHTAVVMFRLAGRYVENKFPEARLQDIVVEKNENYLLAT